MSECRHPRLVGYHGTFIKDDTTLWLIMELCEGGSLSELIKYLPRVLTEDEIATVLHAVLKGLEYLHDHKIVHRDVKAGNIMLNKEGHVKLGDFGVSAQLLHTYSNCQTKIGTPHWMSPELLLQSESTKKTDIWSLGITGIEIAEGNPPYSNIRPHLAMFVIQQNPPQTLTSPHRWSNEFNNFITSCLIINAKKRPTARELLLHPFIQKARHLSILSELIVEANAEKERISVEKEKKEIEENMNMNMNIDMNIDMNIGKDTVKLIGESNNSCEIFDTGPVLVEEGVKQVREEEPSFMKYVKLMNNYDNPQYLREHFFKNGSGINEAKENINMNPRREEMNIIDNSENKLENNIDTTTINKLRESVAVELRGMSKRRIGEIIARLEQDKAAEIKAITLRYQQKLSYYEHNLQIIQQISELTKHAHTTADPITLSPMSNHNSNNIYREEESMNNTFNSFQTFRRIDQGQREGKEFEEEGIQGFQPNLNTLLVNQSLHPYDPPQEEEIDENIEDDTCIEKTLNRTSLNDIKVNHYKSNNISSYIP